MRNIIKKEVITITPLKSLTLTLEKVDELHLIKYAVYLLTYDNNNVFLASSNYTSTIEESTHIFNKLYNALSILKGV